MTAEVDTFIPKVCLEGRIWDLHIHTQSDKLKKISPREYAVKLDELFADERYKNLDLVSFTDHNCINIEAYESFWNAGSHVSLIPGIEVDTYLDKAARDVEKHINVSEPKEPKHLIVYFDAVDDLETTKKLATALNGWLSANAVGPHNPIYIADLLAELINVCHDTQTRFALSPHAMKQNGKKPKGFDSVWSHLEESEQKSEASKYIDQFFCFWEAGQSSVAKAIEFLKEIESDSRVSVISFSDSKCLDDEKQFLDKPRQYFRALPNFNGIVMVGSEPSRILLDSPKEIPSQNQGSYLGSIDFDDSTIELSPQMNAIIGGRGTGKSVLLDSIAHCLGKASQLKKERIDFLGKHSAMIKSMDGLSLNG